MDYMDDMDENGWLWMEMNKGGCKLRTLCEMDEARLVLKRNEHSQRSKNIKINENSERKKGAMAYNVSPVAMFYLHGVNQLC